MNALVDQLETKIQHMNSKLLFSEMIISNFQINEQKICERSPHLNPITIERINFT